MRPYKHFPIQINNQQATLHVLYLKNSLVHQAKEHLVFQEVILLILPLRAALRSFAQLDGQGQQPQSVCSLFYMGVDCIKILAIIFLKF